MRGSGFLFASLSGAIVARTVALGVMVLILQAPRAHAQAMGTPIPGVRGWMSENGGDLGRSGRRGNLRHRHAKGPKTAFLGSDRARESRAREETREWIRSTELLARSCRGLCWPATPECPTRPPSARFDTVRARFDLYSCVAVKGRCGRGCLPPRPPPLIA